MTPTLDISWKPKPPPNVDVLTERLAFYTDSSKAFVVFRFGTAVFSPSKAPLTDAEYGTALASIAKSPPDFRVLPMTDGNYVVRFKGRVSACVMSDEFQKNHVALTRDAKAKGLFPSEVFLSGGEGMDSQAHYVVGLLARARAFQDVYEQSIVSRFP